MIKKVLSVLVFSCYLQAGMINAVALTINDNVITLYDIDQLSTQREITHNQAVTILIDNILYEQELKKLNIDISKDDILAYIRQVAEANNMTMVAFKEAIVKQKQNYQAFVADIKKRLINQKLVMAVAKNKIERATDEDMKLYYDNNIEQFKVDKNSIKVIPFEKVQDKIFQLMMTQREQDYLKEYFETLKITADIKIVR